MQPSNKNNISDLLNQLDEAQRAAVEFCTGPSLVIAGAGSGKTRVLTYKIAYLIEQGLPPYHILALTFTNKAAKEMKSRIAELVGPKKARSLWMGTFHSIFSRILRNEAEQIGFQSNFTIYDTSDSNNLIKQIIKDFNIDEKQYRPNTIHNQISRAKNALITPKMYAANKEMNEYDRMCGRPLVSDIYSQYQQRLRASNAMDFDDLLMFTNILFKNHPETLEKYRNQFQYILVDEYQDTNFAQHLIVKQIADAHHRVCVVGDDAQSIYSFRGANIDNILTFKTHYPNTHIFKLEQNYRSTQNIVNAANSLIKKNKEQLDKTIFSKNEEGEKIELLSAFSDFEEGVIVGNKIARMRYDYQSKYSEFAILYRTNAQSRIFEEALRKKNIPYRIYGGLSFYQRKEIKDVIAYFRLIINPTDETALRRIINYPTRGIGNVTVSKITSAAQKQNISLWEVLSNPLEYNVDINAGTAKKLSGFRTLIDDFIAESKKLNAYELAQKVIKQTGIAAQAYNDMTPEGMSRAQNLEEMLNAMNEFVLSRQEQEDIEDNSVTLTDFLSEVSLLTDQDTDTEHDDEKVTLMTVHSAKGLEFNHVFVVGMEEDLFPSSMAKGEFRGLEEERRLFYVAITRAKETCTLTYAKSRFKNGSINSSRASQFLNDIETKYLSSDTVFQSTSTSKEGFWETMKKQYNQSKKSPSLSSAPSVKAKQNQQNLSPISHVSASSSLSLSKEAQEIKTGDIIEHERFGRGTVTSVESSGNDKRAFVDFDSSGKKQLLLKFAKFRILS